MTLNPVCPSCRETRSRPLLAKDGYAYRACLGCGGAWLHPRPASAESLYDASYFLGGAHGGYVDYEADEAIHRANAVRRLDLIGRVHPGPPGRVLDVGCAVPFFLDEARSRGWQVVGVDASGWARERARERFCIDVRARIDGVAEGDVAVATLYQVLEHVVEPTDTLNAVHRCLQPGGALVLETWDRASAVARLFGRYWQQVTPPSVVHLFTRDGLSALLRRTGFDDVRFERASKAVSVGFVAGLLARKHPRLFGGLAAIARHRLVRSRELHYSLGDLITVTARRRG